MHSPVGYPGSLQAPRGELSDTRRWSPDRPTDRDSPLPGILLCLCFAGLALLAWPGLVERVVALEWQVADMRPVLHGVQALFAALALAAWLARRKVDLVFEKVFPTPGRILALGRPLAIVLEVERGSARYGRTPEREKESHRAADRRLLEWLRAERRGRPIYEDEGYVVWLVSPIEPARR